jgi:hypothetical protein
MQQKEDNDDIIIFIRTKIKNNKDDEQHYELFVISFCVAARTH